MELTEAQKQEMARLKQYFPFRMIFGAIVNGEFQCWHAHTKHRANKLTRQGVKVFMLDR